MPRCRRLKTYDSIYHVMVRSVGDIPLYRNDDDKEYFIELIKKYKEILLFKVYAYCLMDTHGHFIIDSNGADISRIMHSINQSYAQYYNLKYKRHGHVFADRFKSIIVDDDAYLVTLSGYIHRNPEDIKEYSSRLHMYPYSSYGVYLGIREDKYKILDASFVLKQFSSDARRARQLYVKFVGRCNDPKMKETVEFKGERSEYRSERVVLIRDYSIDDVAEFVSRYTGNPSVDMHVKNRKNAIAYKALCILLMRSLCNINYRDICAAAGNISISNASRLCSLGYSIMKSNPVYQNMIGDLIRAQGSK